MRLYDILMHMYQRGNIAVVLMIVFGLFLVGILFGVARSLITQPSSITSEKPVQTESFWNQGGCGLGITAPALQAVQTFPLTLSGYINGCGWLPVSGIGGTVQLLDGNGRALGPVVPLTLEPNFYGSEAIPATFRVVVPQTQTPSMKTGFLFFTNAVSTDPKTVQLPIRF